MKNVVVIGGGTGNSVLLRCIKHYTENITAIVSVADDGGSTGDIRKEFGIVPGDIRSCIVALAEDEAHMTNLMNYRFDKNSLGNHSFGNLFLAAMNEISSSFSKAIKNTSEVLAIKGRVLPVSEGAVTLCAKLEDGNKVYGESKIPKAVVESGSKISRLYIKPNNIMAYEESIEGIKNADIIILSPGSLYTSLLPNLLIKQVSKAISENKEAKKIYICNIMTQPGETNDFNIGDHISALEDHIPYKIFDYVLYNTGSIDKEYVEKYQKRGSNLVGIEYPKHLEEKYNFIGIDLVDIDTGKVRHNAKVLWDKINKL